MMGFYGGLDFGLGIEDLLTALVANIPWSLESSFNCVSIFLSYLLKL